MKAMTRENETIALAPCGVAPAPPCAMVIFGAAGDLTKRLLVPALYDLVLEKRLPPEFRLIGVAMTPLTCTTSSATR